MFSDFFPTVGNLAFLVLFALLGLALRDFAREKTEPAPEAEPELDPRCFAPAARVEAVLAPSRGAVRVERRVASRPVKVERRRALAPEGAQAEAPVEEIVAYESVVARLVPQVPIRRDEKARNWFGGEPEMPAAMPWPKFSGRRGLFLAQICCADLPDGIWNGLGPRRGWLAFFIDPHDGRELRALHFAERAAPRPAPSPGACCVWPQSGLLSGDADGPRRIDAFPRWPLDIVAVSAADEGQAGDPRRAEGADEARHGFKRAGFDLASPEHHPFDWASALAFCDVALAAMARRRALIKASLPDVEKPLASARRQIELGGMTGAMLGEMQRRTEDLPKVIEGWKTAIAALDAALEQVKTMAETWREREKSEPLSQEIATELMAQARAIELIHVERAPDPERGPGAERVLVTRLPLTTHRPDASLFVHDYETLREDWAKHAWCADPDVLPEAQRVWFEARWRDLAAHEMSGMGHRPFRDIAGFNPDSQTVLVEFASSELLKWRFGADGALAAVIDDSALTQSDFTRLRSQISD
ncbi:hypothetical protein CCR94_16710 [Rhodoblastus sphagnicola]|uniref:DUF1963 domain-containing protein n=1 Tax=Rhodoblastus sphagnicola TaxID=333368 RepID=A0A2S6N339_9HYPH|nr:DUF1963 domain-containing protein [Rhodoblastus sphagnicola]MBB4199139.1 hypothetical protein [Rhodoblastus sphagnicola]PPQ29028.1 hypothetical protein CCR94_16710 [Rhodoblastus sphagnicola]